MKNMIGMILTIFNINSTVNANRVIFYFKSIPLLGRLMPSKIYGDTDLKMMATIVVTIINTIRKFLNKFLYVGIMIILPLLYVYEYQIDEIPVQAFINIFFFLSFVAGTVQVSTIFETNRNKYICIKLMRFETRNFVLPTMFARHLANFIYFLPVILTTYGVLGESIWQGLLLVALLTAVRFIGEAGYLVFYEKTGILLIKKYIAQWIIILLACIAAYLPIYFNLVWPIQQNLLRMPVIIIIFISSFAGILYIFKYKDYKTAVFTSMKMDDAMLDTEKIMGEARFSGVKMKEKDFSEESLKSNKFENKQAYEYLNAIFFARHRRLLEKPILIRLCIIGGVSVLLATAALVFPDIEKEMEGGILDVLPAFVFILYFLALGDQICKAMFYNCDISLLRYGFYRKKDVILMNFMVRLKKLTGLNMIIGLGICLAFMAVVLIAGIPFTPLDFILFVLSILCLSTFFSVHHLFLYYVFQPYTTELGMKNPFFKVINTVVYLICFGCLQLKNTPGFFTLALIIVTGLYIISALTLVNKLAPKMFRVK